MPVHSVSSSKATGLLESIPRSEPHPPSSTLVFLRLTLLRRALAGEDGPAATIVALNAGAALYVAGVSDDIGAGIRIALNVMRDGSATRRFDEFIAMTRAFTGPMQ